MNVRGWAVDNLGFPSDPVGGEEVRAGCFPLIPPVDVEPPGMMEFAPSYCPLLIPVSVEGKAFRPYYPGLSHVGQGEVIWVLPLNYL